MISARDVGILLINLGTPDEPSPRAVRRYLREFLSDRRVIELPTLLWKPILHGIILRTRPRKSAHAYLQVWTDAGAPLTVITGAQATELQARLGDAAVVSWAMRYGKPAISERLEWLQSQGCDRILIAPLYPQYSAATTASALDGVAAALKMQRHQPAIRTMPAYFAQPAYIGALSEDLERQISALPFAPEVLLLSFHGMPERSMKLGDPYYAQCLDTARRLAARMAADFPFLRIETSFQSRFGPARWLRPYTDNVLNAEARENGVKRLVIAAPGFSSDCLETREELAIRGREQFLFAGGEEFAVLDCLNAAPAGMTMLETLVRRELSGWI